MLSDTEEDIPFSSHRKKKGAKIPKAPHTSQFSSSNETKTLFPPQILKETVETPNIESKSQSLKRFDPKAKPCGSP